MRRTWVALACWWLIVAAGCGGKKSELTELATEASATVTGFDADEQGVAWLASGKDETVLKYRSSDGSITAVSHGTLFALALDHDSLFWSDGDHVWRTPRGTSRAQSIADTDDIATSIVAANGFLYWATKNVVSRVPVGGGAVEVIARPPADPHPTEPIHDPNAVPDGAFDRIAVDGTRVVAAFIRPVRDTREPQPFQAEIWRLDGTGVRIAVADAPSVVQLAIDGDTVTCQISTRDEITTQSLRGGASQVVSTGRLLDARTGTVYVGRSGDDAGTFAVRGDHAPERLGPRATDGKIVGQRLYGVFPSKGMSTTIGYFDLPR